MRPIWIALLLGACGTQSLDNATAAENGLSGSPLPKAEQVYRDCIMDGVRARANEGSLTFEQAQAALAGCRDELRAAAEAAFDRSPAAERGGDRDAQVPQFMARIENELAREIHPGFPIS